MPHQQNTQQLLQAIQRGQLREAAQKIHQLTQQHPDHADYWHLYSITALQLRQAAKAIEFSKRALQLNETHLDYRTQLASALQHNLQFAEALEQVKRIEAQLKKTTQKKPNILDSLGTIYTHCGDLDNAQRLYEQALQLNPTSPHLLFNLATAYRGNGLFKQAEEIYNKVIDLNPSDYEAYANRSQLRKQTADNNHIEQLAAIQNKGIDNWRNDSMICFALAKELEDTERYAESFSYLKQGCDLRRQHMTYDVDNEIAAIDKIISSFTPATIKQAKNGYESAEPIFVLGLPRTGTTLVERIIDSHSAVISAGELQNFASVLIPQIIQSYPKEKLDKLALIERSTAIDFSQLGKTYIDSTRPATGHSPHFIDKLPLNYLYVGLIKLALPNAKIIHLTRHPLDACYAIYKTAFKDAYPFSYDFDDLGRYYLAYHRLMNHWRELFPEDIYDINYETLVHKQEEESRKLISFCGLEWEEGCLQFHKNPQASMTASSAQVRQPIYKGSVEKWRHYEEQLQPLIKQLQKGGLKTH